MWTPQAQSKRLLFFTVRDAYDKTWQCIAKERDGFLDEAQICQLANTLDSGLHLTLLAYPELGGGEVWLHAMDCTLGQQHLSFGRLTLSSPADDAVKNGARGGDGVGDGEGDDECDNGEGDDECDDDASNDDDRTRARPKGRTRVKKEMRHQNFVAWLVENFGLDRLQSGVVLDVAGGAGGVAFELSFRRSIACTVVDPRAIKVSLSPPFSPHVTRHFSNVLITGFLF